MLLTTTLVLYMIILYTRNGNQLTLLHMITNKESRIMKGNCCLHVYFWVMIDVRKDISSYFSLEIIYFSNKRTPT